MELDQNKMDTSSTVGNNAMGQDPNQGATKHDIPFNIIEEVGMRLHSLYHQRTMLLDFQAEVRKLKKVSSEMSGDEIWTKIGSAIEHQEHCIKILEGIN